MHMTIHIWDFAYIDLSSTHLQCWALGRHTFYSHHQSSLYISYLQRKWAGWTPLCRGQWMWWYCHGTDTWCCHHYRKSLSDTVLFWPSLEHQGVSQLLGEGKQKKNKNKKYMWLNQKKKKTFRIMHGGSYQTCITQISQVSCNAYTYQILFIDIFFQKITSEWLWGSSSGIDVFKKYKVQSLPSIRWVATKSRLHTRNSLCPSHD